MTSTSRLRVVIAVLFGFAALGVVATSPPRLRGEDAPAREFSGARAGKVLRRLLDRGAPHALGSPDHAGMRERVLGELRQAGLAPWVEEGFACSPYGSCATVRNVLAEIPGQERGKLVLLVAHYDSVGAGSGAGDDASSVAAAMEVVRALRERGHRHGVLLLIGDGEEAGLLGAEAFVRTPRAASVGAVVNLEARGTSGPSLLFETGSRNAWLVRHAVTAMRRPVTSSVFSFVYDRLPNDTDLTVFKREGMQGLNLAFIGSPSRYHTRHDSLENLSRRTLQHHGENALALVASLAAADLSAVPEGRAVFFDVLGLVLVWWPQGASIPLALLGLLLVRLACRKAGRTFGPSGRSLVPSLALLASATAGALVWQALRLLGVYPVPFVACPWPGVLAAASAGLLAAIPVLVRQARRPTPDGGWERVWTSLGLLALLLAAFAPEFCYLLLVPVLVAGVAGLAVRASAAVWLPFATLSALLLPLVLRLPEALGPLALPIVALAFGACLSVAAPFVDHTARPARTGAFLAVLTVLSGVLAVLTPTSTVSLPEHGSLQAVIPAEGPGSARLVFRPASGTLPPGLRGNGTRGFESRAGILPWAPSAELLSSALSVPHEVGPSLRVEASVALPDGSRRLGLRLSSGRGASQLGAYLDEEARDVLVNGVELARPYLRNPGPRSRRLMLTLRAVPSEGVRVDLTLPAGKVTGYVVDVTPGLPPEAAPVANARPETMTPVGAGDVTTVWRRVEL